MKKYLFIAFAIFLTCSSNTFASYVYSDTQGEYTITLPAPPQGETIWGDSKDVPYIDVKQYSGRIGSKATFKRKNFETGDFLNVEIITLASDKSFIQSLNEEKLSALAEEQYNKIKLLNLAIGFSEGGKNPVRKAVRLTGELYDKNGDSTKHHLQIMTGIDTLTALKISYSADNPAFEKDYQNIIGSIKFIGK